MDDKKTVLLGVTGGIAVYKAVNLCSLLRKKGYDVHVIMTQNACQFVSPLTFETMTNNAVVVDQFSMARDHEIEHIALAKKADIFVCAPATANAIAKFAHGIADDALSTQALACTCPKIIAPAMNTAMYENPITQDNMKILNKYGFTVIPAAVGLLACKDVGAGKFPEEDIIVQYIEKEIAREKDFKGKKVLVTAGATRESLDPVRFITNHSTGTMGFSIAKEFMLRGAEVTLVAASAVAKPPMFVNLVRVESAEDMFKAVTKVSKEQDIIIKAAAVADYTPKEKSKSKIKKDEAELNLELNKTKDILAYLGDNKEDNQFLCGFAMETENLVINARKKLSKKNLDMIVANSLRVKGAGFGTDTNVATIITEEREESLGLMTKEILATEIADAIYKQMNR